MQCTNIHKVKEMPNIIHIDELSAEEMSDADEMTHSPKTQEQGDDESEGTSQVQDEQMEEEGDSLYGFGDSEPEAESTSSSSSSASELPVPFEFNSVEIPQQDHEEDEEQDQKDICFTTEFFDPNTDDLSKLGFKPKGVSEFLQQTSYELMNNLQIKCLSWHAGTWYCLVSVIYFITTYYGYYSIYWEEIG